MLKRQKQTVGFFILLALAGLVVAMIFWPFWQLLAFAVILAMLFHPLYNRLEAHTKMPNFSAGVVVTIIAAIIVGPVLLIGQQLFFELADLYKNLHVENWLSMSTNHLQKLPMPVQQIVLSLNVDLQSWATQFTANAFSTVSGLLSSLGWFFGSLIVVAFSVFFLLRDWEQIKKVIMELLPLSTSNENILFDKISTAVGGVIRGQFLVVLTITTAAFIGFLIFGLPNPLLWAAAMFVGAFVPTFGTGLVWVPAVAYLYFTGNTGSAIGMAIWAAASVALIDNVLSAKLVSSRARLHPLLTIFAILGGIVSFGALGVLLGPVIMAIFVALLSIYRTEIK